MSPWPLAGDTAFFLREAPSRHAPTDTLRATGSAGEAGRPVPYTTLHDSQMTLGVLVLTTVLVVLVTRFQRFLKHQWKNFFRRHSEEHWELTPGEVRFMQTATLAGLLLTAIGSYAMASDLMGIRCDAQSAYQMTGCVAGLLAAYIVAKRLLHTLVDITFLEGKTFLHIRLIQWFVWAHQSLAVLPLLLLQIYFDLDTEKVLYGLTFIVLTGEILLFYKYWTIFLHKKFVFLQTFLYFCTLEIVPLLALTGIWIMVAQQF